MLRNSLFIKKLMNVGGYKMPKILLYNERCAICYRMARYTWKLTRGRIRIIGMFSKRATPYREAIMKMLGNNEDLYSSMPWLIDGRKAMGGISIVLPVVLEAIISIFKPGNQSFGDPKPMQCEPMSIHRGHGIHKKVLFAIEVFAKMVIQSYRSILIRRYIVYLPDQQDH
jgi:hypothetical protein